MRNLILVSVACAWFVACGGADSPSNGTQSGTSGARTDGGSGSSPGSSSSGGSDAGAVTTAALDVVFNEVAAVGSSEWIEIANKGDTSVDLGGYYIADSAKDTGEPKKSDAMQFPPGTTLPIAGRIVIVVNKKNGTVGPHPQADCIPEGPDGCYFASFGVSATSGESLHLLAPDGSIITSTAMPKTLGADAGGAANQTQCRIPDLTGDFVACAPTPGEANRTP
jgi:hypothetical protein